MGLAPSPWKTNSATKASTTRNQSFPLRGEGSPSRRLMTLCGKSRKKAARPTPLLTPRTITRVATWNIRTMFEAGRTHQVAREMRNYSIRVLGLSETRWLQTGQLRVSSGEQLLYSSHTEDGAPHTEGVALMLAPEAQLALIGWEPVNSLIITAKFTTKKKDIRLNILQSYAPINDAGREEGRLLPATPERDRQRRSHRHDHPHGRFQCQYRLGQHWLQGLHWDSRTGPDE